MRGIGRTISSTVSEWRFGQTDRSTLATLRKVRSKGKEGYNSQIIQCTRESFRVIISMGEASTSGATGNHTTDTGGTI